VPWWMAKQQPFTACLRFLVILSRQGDKEH
jgi:hypothetical protein